MNGRPGSTSEERNDVIARRKEKTVNTYRELESWPGRKEEGGMTLEGVVSSWIHAFEGKKTEVMVGSRKNTLLSA